MKVSGWHSPSCRCLPHPLPSTLTSPITCSWISERTDHYKLPLKPCPFNQMKTKICQNIAMNKVEQEQSTLNSKVGYQEEKICMKEKNNEHATLSYILMEVSNKQNAKVRQLSRRSNWIHRLMWLLTWSSEEKAIYQKALSNPKPKECLNWYRRWRILRQ